MRNAFLLIILLPMMAGAETAYVTDNLRLGLHQSADTSDRAFRTLESGQELEILSRDRNYASVRLPDGVLGNVKVAYLVFEKPAKLIVAETQAALVAAEAELERNKVAFAAPAATIAALESRLAESEETLETSTAQVAKLSTEVDDFQSQHDQYKFSLPFKWVGGAMFVCLLGGFLVGLWWVDHRSRKRHGGIRIY